MDDMDDMDNMDNMDDMKKVEKSLFQRDSAMAGWLTKFAPHSPPHYAFMVLDIYVRKVKCKWTPCALITLGR